ncbi:MAG: hypothetical protein ACTSSP_10035 [Candidatus Asgardarchaeia archaeon]
MSEDREEIFEMVDTVPIHGETIGDEIEILIKLKLKYEEEYYRLSLILDTDGEDHYCLRLYGNRKEDDTERKGRIAKKIEFDKANEEWTVKEEKKEKEELKRLAKKYKYHLEDTGASRRNIPVP